LHGLFATAELRVYYCSCASYCFLWLVANSEGQKRAKSQTREKMLEQLDRIITITKKINGTKQKAYKSGLEWMISKRTLNVWAQA